MRRRRQQASEALEIELPPLAFGVAGYAIVRDTEAAAQREVERITTLVPGSPGYRNYADWIVALMRPHLGTRVLEIGAGHGTITERLADGERHVTASDLSPRCVDVLQERFAGRADVDIVKGDARAAAGDRPVDTAVLVNVLEHIPDDVQALRDLYDALEPGVEYAIRAPLEGFLERVDTIVLQAGEQRRLDIGLLRSRPGCN
jgi:2-polyprenyl-3-methyl-5-hydroxy-6-metoxy-1,4-benzoquinol methylase